VVFDKEDCSLTMELKDAYPAEAGLEHYKRTIKLDEEKVEVTEDISLKATGEVCFNFLLCGEPTLAEAGLVLLERGHTLTYDKSLTATIETIPLEDAKIKNDWKRENLFSLKLEAKGVKKMLFKTFIK
jgi:hypothetical protein